MPVAVSSYGDLVWGVLTRSYGERRHGVELLARDGKVTPATAANWLRKRCAPQGDNLMELMRECDELRDAIIAAAQRKEQQ